LLILQELLRNSYYIKFYPLVTHLPSCKSGEFYCIIYSIDKIRCFQSWQLDSLTLPNIVKVRLTVQTP